MTRPLATVLFLCAAAFAQRPDAIEWSKDLDAALASSREDSRPVIAYFTFHT